MLFGQYLRRGHQRDVEAAFQRHQRRAGGHGGFARPDIALQQPPHRMRAGRAEASGRRLAAHVLPDFAQHCVCAPVSLKPSRARNGFIS